MADSTEKAAEKPLKGRKRAEDPRIIIYSVRYNSTENKRLFELAKAFTGQVEEDKIDISTFIRNASLGEGKKSFRMPKITLETKAEIRKIGVNINQISKEINSKRLDKIDIFIKEIDNINIKLKEIIDLLSD